MTPGELYDRAESVVIAYNTQAMPGWTLNHYIQEALRAAVAADRERCAQLLETKQAVSIPGTGWTLVDDDEPDRVRIAYAAAIRALP